MKPVLTFLSIFFCVTFLAAQSEKDIEVPFAVLDQFSLNYPDAKSILWEKKGEKYQARFKNDKMETMAMLSDSGEIIKTETEIKAIALPEAATAYLQKNFEDKKIEETKIMEDQAGIITFRAQVEKVDFTFDSNGQLIATDQVVIGSK